MADRNVIPPSVQQSMNEKGVMNALQQIAKNTSVKNSPMNSADAIKALTKLADKLNPVSEFFKRDLKSVNYAQKAYYNASLAGLDKLNLNQKSMLKEMEKQTSVFGKVANGLGNMANKGIAGLMNLPLLAKIGGAGLLFMLMTGDFKNFGKMLGSIPKMGGGLLHYLVTGDKTALDESINNFRMAIPQKGLLGWIFSEKPFDLVGSLLGTLAAGPGGLVRAMLTGDWTTFGNDLSKLPDNIMGVFKSLSNKDGSVSAIQTAILGGIGIAGVKTAFDLAKFLKNEARETANASNLAIIARNTAMGGGSGGGSGGGIGSPIIDPITGKPYPNQGAGRKAEKAFEKAAKYSGTGKVANPATAAKAEKQLEKALKLVEKAEKPLSGLSKFGGKGNALMIGLSALMMAPSIIEGAETGDFTNTYRQLPGLVLGGLGSWGGSIGGGIVGSIVPGAGTVIGAGAGMLGGGYLGSQVGNWIGNTMFGVPSQSPQNTLPTEASNLKVSSELMEYRMKNYEGKSWTAYKDADGYSIGYGHKIKPGEEWLKTATITPEYAQELLRKDVAEHTKAASMIPGFYSYNAKTQEALINMTYNMGPTWYKKWPRLMTAISTGNNEEIAKEIRGTNYANQVKGRAEDMIKLLTDGKVTSNGSGNTPPLVTSNSQSNNNTVSFDDKTLKFFNDLWGGAGNSTAPVFNVDPTPWNG